MRISTYNIWNSDIGMPDRAEQVLNELRQNGADVFCLQEVTANMFNKISEELICNYFHYNEEEELLIVSNYPIVHTMDMEFALGVKVDVNGKFILVINCHLPWKSALSREKAIVGIVESVDRIDTDHTIISGDFNCSPNSSVHGFLRGDNSLLGKDTLFFDVAESFASREGARPSVTLDYTNNLRWKDERPIETNQRYDRILIKNCFPKPSPKLMKVGLFGTCISEKTELCASDHYGVFADFTI